MSKAPFTLQEKMGPDRKKVGMNQIFLPCKPSVPCLHEMDPDSLFSGFGAIGAYGPKTEKKTTPDPFCCSKRCVNASSFRALLWFRACVQSINFFTMASVISGKKLYVVHTDAMYFLSNFT